VIHRLFLIGFLVCCPLLYLEFSRAEDITLSGTVKDKAANIPLDSALVEIVSGSQRFSTFTNSSGFWTYTIKIPTSGVSADGNYPNMLSLYQNYPNPFNPSTKISFAITQTGNVSISVHNILGQELDSKTFSLAPGCYVIDWFSKGSSGVLFYSVEINGTRLTCKMVQLDGSSSGGLGNLITVGKGTTNFSLSKSSGVFTVIASKLRYEADTLVIAAINNSQVNFLLELLHTRAFVIDLHNDVMEKVVTGYELGMQHSYNHSDIPRFREGGVDAQIFALWVEPTNAHPYQQTVDMISAFNSQVARNSLYLAQARTPDEIAQVNAEGKIAGILGVEGGHAIENDLEKLRELYRRGARYLTITWNNSTDWAISAQDPQSTTKGLSDFGRQVIRTMDSLGMIIDVSHTGIKTIEDILEITKNPIIASHSGVKALRNHYRNLSDSQIVRIARIGGVIGVVFYPPFLCSNGKATIDTVLKHIDYIVRLVGVDYVALGSDYDGMESTPVGLEDVSKFPNLTDALLRHGYSNRDVKKILGENFLRVFKKVSGEVKHL